MTFTDEELEKISTGRMAIEAGTKFGALLNRLAKAEQVCKELRPTPADHSDYVYGSTRDKLKKWMGACGKAE